jgi:hypothetical protein
MQGFRIQPPFLRSCDHVIIVSVMWHGSANPLVHVYQIYTKYALQTYVFGRRPCDEPVFQGLRFDHDAIYLSEHCKLS